MRTGRRIRSPNQPESPLCLSAASPEENFLRILSLESITARPMPGTVCRHVSSYARLAISLGRGALSGFQMSCVKVQNVLPFKCCVVLRALVEEAVLVASGTSLRFIFDPWLFIPLINNEKAVLCLSF